jgi:hypothetical protein
VRDELTAAVTNRRIVTFTYQGFPRRVQPAEVGVNRKGKDTLHAYQVDGGSKRGGIPHWRNFHVEDMQGLAVLDEVFGPNPPGYESAGFTTTYVSLKGGASGGSTPPPSQPSGQASGQPAAPAADQVIPGVPITSEQAAKAVEQAGAVIGNAAEALGKWFRKKR